MKLTNKETIFLRVLQYYLVDYFKNRYGKFLSEDALQEAMTLIEALKVDSTSKPFP